MSTSTIIRDIRCAVEASRGDPGFFPTSEMVLRLAAELESVAAERDRLQRACDEGLPREVIPCPACKAPHVEGPRHDDPTQDGRTRPHHTHRCYGCGHVWDDGRWTFGVAPGDENDVTRRLRAEGRAAGLREAMALVRERAGDRPLGLSAEDHLWSVIRAALREAEGGGA